MASKADTIMASLISAGYTTGSLVDRERLRLITATTPPNPDKLSLYDLYKLAGERPRL